MVCRLLVESVRAQILETFHNCWDEGWRWRPSVSEMKMMGESEYPGPQCHYSCYLASAVFTRLPAPCSPHSSHTRKTLSRSRIRPPGRLGWLVPRYRNNAYSRSWPLPTAGPWACPGPHSPHSVSQMRLCALLVIIGSVFSQKLPFVGNIKWL